MPHSVTPYLSVVAASRNDDHGGDPLVRTQIFVNSFARQCERYRLPAELIIIDWNPVPDRPALAAALSIPAESTYCQTRVITVPTVLHRRLKYADKLPFFQMVAKNVGIRRARGYFILATNIDIIFSDELVRFIARQELDSKKLYRVDRYDIKSGLTQDCTLDESLEYAWTNRIRAHHRYQPKSLVNHLFGEEIFKKVCIPEVEFRKASDGVQVFEEHGVWQICPERTVMMTHLHTNACGDFTLLSREGWYAVRGYPEFEAFSFNIDSLGFVAAHYAGYQEVSLLPPCACFHIEHGIGSGWTPEGEKKLFARLREAGVLNPDWPVLTPLVDAMREQGRALEFNHAGWGMADFDLPEQSIGDLERIPAEKLERLALQAETRAVSAIQPTYDLDRLTLAHERRLAREQSVASVVLTAAANAEKIVLSRILASPKRWLGLVVERVFVRGNRELILKIDSLHRRVAAAEHATSAALEPAVSHIDRIAADVTRLTDGLGSLRLQPEALRKEREAAQERPPKLSDALSEVYGTPPTLRPIPGWHTYWGVENGSNRFLPVRAELWSSLKRPVLMRWLADLLIMIWPGNELSRVLFLTGNFEPNELTWMSQTLIEGMTMIDIGAHMGMYALTASKLVGESGVVVALEPSTREFQRLSFHISLNDLRNVRCFQLAASSACREATLKIASEWNSGHNTFGEFFNPEVETIREERVPKQTLDALVAGQGLERVDVIKIDVEGHELQVLAGAVETLTRFRPSLLIEVFEETLRRQGASVEAVLGFLTGHGYVLNEFSDVDGGLVPLSRSPGNESRNLVALPK